MAKSCKAALYIIWKRFQESLYSSEIKIVAARRFFSISWYIPHVWQIRPGSMMPSWSIKILFWRSKTSRVEFTVRSIVSCIKSASLMLLLDRLRCINVELLFKFAEILRKSNTFSSPSTGLVLLEIYKCFEFKLSWKSFKRGQLPSCLSDALVANCQFFKHIFVQCDSSTSLPIVAGSNSQRSPWSTSNNWLPSIFSSMIDGWGATACNKIYVSWSLSSQQPTHLSIQRPVFFFKPSTSLMKLLLSRKKLHGGKAAAILELSRSSPSSIISVWTFPNPRPIIEPSGCSRQRDVQGQEKSRTIALKGAVEIAFNMCAEFRPPLQVVVQEYAAAWILWHSSASSISLSTLKLSEEDFNNLELQGAATHVRTAKGWRDLQRLMSLG